MTETTKIDNSNHMENTLNTESIEASIEEISENQDNKIQYDITYQKAKKYLKEVGFLSEESFVYPEQVVDDIYRALAADKKNLTGLASKLTDITEVPQENDKKSILKDLSTKKIQNFFIQTIFKKDSFLEFVADLVKSKDDDKKTVKYVWQDILDKIAHLKPETIKKIEKDIIFPCMPVFEYYADIPNMGRFRIFNRLEYLVIGSIPWVYIHAALHFLNDNSIDFNPYIEEYLLQIGAFLEHVIKKGSIPEKVRYFLIPVALSYAIKNTDVLVEEILNSPVLREKVVTEFFNSVDKENEEIKAILPINKFIKAMDGYKTRTELAKEKLASIGIIDNEGAIAAYKAAPDSFPSTIDARLPNLTEIFAKQNEEIAKKFSIWQKIALTDAIDRLSLQEDKDFFNLGKVSYAKFVFTEKECYYGMKETYIEDNAPKVMELSLPYPHCSDITVLKIIEYI